MGIKNAKARVGPTTGEVVPTEKPQRSFGTATVRDGLRPHFYESLSAEPAASHEFVGDLTAILMAFRNNGFRELVLDAHGDLDTDQLLAGPARQFGKSDDSYSLK